MISNYLAKEWTEQLINENSREQVKEWKDEEINWEIKVKNESKDERAKISVENKGEEKQNEEKQNEEVLVQMAETINRWQGERFERMSEWLKDKTVILFLMSNYTGNSLPVPQARGSW